MHEKLRSHIAPEWRKAQARYFRQERRRHIIHGILYFAGAFALLRLLSSIGVLR